jgi:Cupin-like domain
MLKLFIGFFIFCIVLFIYLHIQFHLKTSNDLEVFELDHASKDKLDEICDLRQPVIFDFDNDKIVHSINKRYISNNYNSFEIKIRNSKDTDYNSEIFMPIPFHAAKKLFDEDKSASYFSENNSDFLQETGLVKHMQYNDSFIRPPMVSNCSYDILLGSEKTKTPFRYEINYRNFFLLTEGKAVIKLSPPQNSKYLYPDRDYEFFEFRSPVNPWNVQHQYSADFDKMKCLDVILTPGKTINIPAYWWYSIEFEKDSFIACFKYRTYMNNAAIIPHIAMYALQLQNVKRDVVKKHNIDDLNEKNIQENNKNLEE